MRMRFLLPFAAMLIGVLATPSHATVKFRVVEYEAGGVGAAASRARARRAPARK